MSDREHHDDIAILGLLINQTQAINDLGERIGDLEEDVLSLKAGQTRLMAFSGVIGTALGFTMGHIYPIVTFLKGMLA